MTFVQELPPKKKENASPEHDTKSVFFILSIFPLNLVLSSAQIKRLQTSSDY